MQISSVGNGLRAVPPRRNGTEAVPYRVNKSGTYFGPNPYGLSPAGVTDWSRWRFGQDFLGQFPVFAGGGQSEGLLVMFEGLAALPATGQGEAEVLMGVGVVRLESQGLLKMGDSLAKCSAAGKGDAQVVVGGGVAGLDFQGDTVLRDGLVNLSTRRTNKVPETRISGLPSIVGLDLQGPAILGDGLVGAVRWPASASCEVVVGPGRRRAGCSRARRQ